MAFFMPVANDGQARAGLIDTAHGRVETPVFMPVATQGAVKCVSNEEMETLAFPLIIANTYHLAVRPGVDLIRRIGGLHEFMSWNGSIATDSGGFQVMSLAGHCRISDEGAVFRAPVDGKRHEFTPENVIGMQAAFGSDMAMVLDECVPLPAPRERLEKAVDRTTLWARRSRATPRGKIGALFGIVQGGCDDRLRERSAKELVALDFDGYAIGGLSVGEEKGDTFRTARTTAALLPPDRPRYLMGVGEPGDVVQAIECGIDMFDCVFPTRVARNGLALTRTGRVCVRNAASAGADGPLDRACKCPACTRYGSAYLRHLIRAREVNGMRLLTLHNLAFMRDLVRDAREAIRNGTFAQFRAAILHTWKKEP